MADDGVGDRDDPETKSVTAKMTEAQLEELRTMFPDCPNDSERVRRAVWLTTNYSSIQIDRDADDTE